MEGVDRGGGNVDSEDGESHQDQLEHEEEGKESRQEALVNKNIIYLN